MPTVLLEGATARMTATVQDEAGTAIPGGTLSTLTLTYYDFATQTILNNRNKQNVLNANDVTVDGNGLLTWTLQPADVAIVGSGTYEVHVALFEWTWLGGTKAGKHQEEIIIQNLLFVP